MACAKLNETRIQLTNTQSQLNDTQIQLRDTQLQLRNTQDKVNVLESPCLTKIAGVHTWKICGFEEKMKKAKSREQTLISSPPFYDQGYKFALTLEPNDTIFSPTIVSVTFYLTKGEYDAVLSWPVPNNRVTITMIDQQEDPSQRVNKDISFTSHDQLYKKIFARVENDESQFSLSHGLISHEDLGERRYVVDDTIFIQIQIDPV